MVDPSTTTKKTNLPQVPTVTLIDGNEMPLLGLGTSDSKGEPGYEAVRHALRVGYRFIDTAELYGSEEGIGAAIKEAIEVGLVKREDLFILTKVWCTSHKRESVMKACKRSLKKLGLDYVDLYLIHWPIAFQDTDETFVPRDPQTGKLVFGDAPYTETWRGMEDVKDAGLAKSIGLSNFNREMIDKIIALPCKHRPSVNQVECHGYLTQEKLLQYSKKEKIILNAYCPLGSPGACAGEGQPAVMDDPLVKQLALKYKKSASQILIRFLIQRGIPAIPKSVTPSRIEENIDVFDFNLSQEDVDKLLKLDRNLRYCLKLSGESVDGHPDFPFSAEY